MLKGTIMLLKFLCVLRVKENVREPVCKFPRFQWSHVSKLAGSVFRLTIIANSLYTFVFWIPRYCKTTISDYLSSQLDYLAFHFVGHMIPKTILTEKPPVACCTIFLHTFKTGRCCCTYGAYSVTLVYTVYNLSHALHIYLQAIAALSVLLTFYCPALYRRCSFWFEANFHWKWP